MSFQIAKKRQVHSICKAIDDAVALGADAINMSLGSSTGSMVDAGSDIVDAIKRARAKEYLFLSQQK